ncbi:MAG: XRE family transcriptional regulator [Actinobacteria bacterium]|nr:MAG: XRE family transcriptional regulator [Actinomycetota bacterium]
MIVSDSKQSDLGEFIRQQRERANLSLRRLADAAGISNPYLSQIERGIRKPSAEILKRLSRALEISANSMYSKAGLIDDDFESPSVFDAIDADASLTSEQKKVLLDLYRTMSRANGLAAENDQSKE